MDAKIVFMMVVLVSAMGAKAQKNVNKNTQATSTDTLDIFKEEQHLGEVVVTARRPTYVQHIDKRVFNVGSDAMSQSVSASELMQNIPSVQVDVDGNVSLRGNENVTILIDGKPSTLMGTRTRADALRQIPANQIERIEVINNPSAQFKPDGTSGIINIVMKQLKEHPKRVDGTVTANVGTKERVNATASVNYRVGNANLMASYGLRQDNKRMDETDDRTRYGSTTTTTHQQLYQRSRPLSHIARIGADWAIDKNDRLQLTGSYNHRSFTKHANILVSTGDNNFFDSNRTRIDDEYVKQWETGINYTHTFAKDNELSLAYTYSNQKGLEDNRYFTIATDGESRDNSRIWQAYRQHLATIAYTRKLGESTKLNLGYELTHLTTDLNNHIQVWDGSAFIVDVDKTNDFTNRQVNNALYATLEMTRGKWGLLLGIRPELMNITSYLIHHSTFNTQHYFMVYPTLHSSYTLNDHDELQLNYSLRINRPEADDMNPFPEYQNPMTVKAGNPDLKPEKIHSVEAGYQWRGGQTTILTTLYYRYTLNKITSVAHYSDNTILKKTKENMNGSSAAGMELIVNTKLGRWAKLNMSGNLYGDRINVERLGYGKDKTAVAWNAALNATFNIFAGATSQLNARYTSSSLIPQGRRSGTFTTDVAMRYDVPKTHLTLSATLTDMLHTFRKSITLDTPELHQHVDGSFDSRVLYLGATWTF